MSGQPIGLNASMDEPASPNGEWFRTVVGRHEAALVRYSARITGDMEQARDVVQDAFFALTQPKR